MSKGSCLSSLTNIDPPRQSVCLQTLPFQRDHLAQSVSTIIASCMWQWPLLRCSWSHATCLSIGHDYRPRPLFCGVHQGSALGPLLLFLVYTKKLSSITYAFGLNSRRAFVPIGTLESYKTNGWAVYYGALGKMVLIWFHPFMNESPPFYLACQLHPPPSLFESWISNLILDWSFITFKSCNQHLLIQPSLSEID